MFGGSTTNLLTVGIPALYVQSALNDLPVLSPGNLVTVTQAIALDGVSIIYSVQFSSDLGDVPLITEVLGLVNVTVTEATKGQASGKRIQLNIQNTTTSLFNVKNSTDVVFVFSALKF